MTRRAPLPESLRESPFSREEAILAGMSASRLRASDLVRPFHGVHGSLALPQTVRWRCRAYLKRMRRVHAFSHDTAALLYGMPLPIYADSEKHIHVTVAAGCRPPETRGVVGHEIAAGLWGCRDLVLRDYDRDDMFALPVVTAPLMWAQMSARLMHDDLVALGDAMVTGAEPLANVDELRAMTTAWAGRRGARSMSRAIDEIRCGPRSRPESLMRLQIVRAGLPEPELNVTVTDLNGGPIAMADFSWPAYRVVVEYEGDWHRSTKSKFRSDMTRGETYADGEWFGVRANADDVFDDPNPFLARLERRLRARGWHPRRRELRQIVAAQR